MKTSRQQVELSSEDALRINVLVANAKAVRIDESQLIVYGLDGDREMKFPLTPTCGAERYVARVRETLAAAVLDSPGGYPVFLRRWTRMGQIDSGQLDRLLMLGEPEAVVAVICSPGITDELARRAWWVAPYSEHARRMLQRPQIVAGPMGPILAEHLVEHLPFETEHRDMLETVRLVLQPGLIDESRRQRLWEAGRAKKTYRVGFLEADPDRLPDPLPARHDHEASASALAPLVAAGNRFAELLEKALGSSGQTFLDVAADALRRPADQEVVSALVNAIGRYFAAARLEQSPLSDFAAITAAVEQALAEPGTELGTELAAVREAVPDLAAELRAMLLLAHIDEALLVPIFALTDAVGSVMRKRIEPVTLPLGQTIGVLRGAG